jgi:beta-phosphoglucomutase-like phosphatase (HAD superfamily)
VIGTTAFLFDLDGTLVDSVYNHVRAWHLALREEGIHLSVWRIHRKIGMSGGLFTAQLQRARPRDRRRDARPAARSPRGAVPGTLR